MAADLKIGAPSLIVVSASENTGSAEIQYELTSAPPKSGVQLYWKRLYKKTQIPFITNPWNAFDLATLVGGSDFRQKGRFELKNAIKSTISGDPGLGPGETLSVIALREDFPNENLGDPSKVNVERVLRRILITAIRDKVTIGVPNWLHNNFNTLGGTFYLRDIAGTRDFAMMLRMSRGSPLIDPATGAFVLTDEMSVGLTAFSKRHKLEISSLDPGNTYFCVVRLIDEGGHCWEFIDSPTGSSPFATLRRRITVHWDKVDPIYVDEDEAELNVRFSIIEGQTEVGGGQ